MRLLLDANLSPRICIALRQAGHDATHVSELEMGTSGDDVILASAAETDSVLISSDSDFGTLLAASGADSPSVLLLRSADHLKVDEQASLIVGAIAELVDDLASGSIISVSPRRARVRALPITRGPA